MRRVFFRRIGQQENPTPVGHLHHVRQDEANLTTGGRPPSIGYVRVKIRKRLLLTKAIIDSGNLYGDIISEQLAKDMGLKIRSSPASVGTAAAGGSVKVLGRVQPIDIYIEGIKHPITIRPSVVRDLAHHMNLGQDFLRNHQADMTFRPGGIQLKVKGNTAALVHAKSSITQPSIDTRIDGVIQKWREDGRNPDTTNSDILKLSVNQLEQEHRPNSVKGSSEASNSNQLPPPPDTKPMPGLLHSDKKKIMVWANSGRNIHNMEIARLAPRCHNVIQVACKPGEKLPRFKNSVLIQPKQNQKFMNKKGLFLHPGTYLREGNHINVLVTNFGKKEVTLGKGLKIGKTYEGVGYDTPTINTLDHRDERQLSPADLAERRSYVIEHLKLSDNPLLAGKAAVQEKLVQIFLDNWDAISVSDTDYGKTDRMKFTINLEPGARPVHSRVRPLNPHQEKDLKRQLEEWEQGGIIEKSMSPWASALVPCKKKGSDTLRWAIDYRRVNELTIKDRFPLNSIDSNLHKLGGSAIFSCLDAIGAFHSLVVDEKYRDITSFVSPFGSYRFVRLPFGLCNAPSAYSRLVQMALDQLPCGFTLAYIDDVIIHSPTIEDHIDHVEQVLRLHAKFGMKLRLNKCHMFQREVEYLGHLISAQGIRMIPSYVEKILSWPLPTTGKDLKSFLGFTGYYRSFIKEYSGLTAEMNKAKLDREVKWTENMKSKFETLKHKFQTGPVRGYPDYKNPEPFVVDTDFSATNMAAVLSQKQNGKEVFLGCVAKKCNSAQQAYPSHKGELCAVALGLQRFEHILRYRPFIIRTDSSCLKYLNSMKEYKGMFARIQAFLAGFDYTVVHRSGNLQRNADALSRMKGLPESEGDNLETDGHMKEVDDLYHLSEALTQEDVQQAVHADGILQQIKDYVKAKHKPDKEERKTLTRMGINYVNVFERLSLNEDILYYQAPEVNGIIAPKRICLPLELQEKAFRLCHSHETMGHYGVNNTFFRMRQRFYFPNMYLYVESRVLNCVNCVTKRITRPKGKHEMHRERLTYFGQRVYTDTVKLALSPRKFRGVECKYILTIQDGWSRYLQAIPVPREDEKTLAKALVENWVYVHGCPETLHSDRGSAYTSKLFMELMRALNILKTVTPAYSPEGDRVERSHQVLGNLLRSDHRFDPTDWTAKLPVAVFAYNATRNRMTGISPYEAVFGHSPVMPVDLVFPLQRKEGVSWSKYVQELRGKYQRIMEAMCKIQNAALHISDPAISFRKKSDLKEGDSVYWFVPRVEPGKSSKLQRRWLGPFMIRRIVSESLLVIYPSGNWSKRPREISTIVSRVRKVDPKWIDPSSTSRRYVVDLEDLQTEFGDGLEENITYGGEEEDPRHAGEEEDPRHAGEEEDPRHVGEEADPGTENAHTGDPDEGITPGIEHGVESGEDTEVSQETEAIEDPLPNLEPEPPAEPNLVFPETPADPPPPILAPRKRKLDDILDPPPPDPGARSIPNIPPLNVDQPPESKPKRRENGTEKKRPVVVRTITDPQVPEIRQIQRTPKSVRFADTGKGIQRTRCTAPPVPERTTRVTRSGARKTKDTISPEEVAHYLTRPKKGKRGGRPL